VFEDTPVDEGQVRELASGDFIEAKRNLILIGGTGTGKTHLEIAIVAAVIRTRARGRFFNLVDLVNPSSVKNREAPDLRGAFE
jgi:DNA replication protein DnaC